MNMINKFENETFKNYNDDYQISTHGRVLDIKNNVIIDPVSDKITGRNKVYINGKYHYIDYMVARAFILCEDSKKTKVYHLDGDSSNDRVNNLIWVTQVQLLDLFLNKHNREYYDNAIETTIDTKEYNNDIYISNNSLKNLLIHEMYIDMMMQNDTEFECVDSPDLEGYTNIDLLKQIAINIMDAISLIHNSDDIGNKINNIYDALNFI